MKESLPFFVDLRILLVAYCWTRGGCSNQLGQMRAHKQKGMNCGVQERVVHVARWILDVLDGADMITGDIVARFIPLRACAY